MTVSVPRMWKRLTSARSAALRRWRDLMCRRGAAQSRVLLLKTILDCARRSSIEIWLEIIGTRGSGYQKCSRLICINPLRFCSTFIRTGFTLGIAAGRQSLIRPVA